MLSQTDSDLPRTPVHLMNFSSEGGTKMRPTKILVVEDERHIARLLEFVLRKAGYELSICHSAEQALKEMEDGRPDALVLDLVLPGMTGLDFLRTIRASPYSCDCIVMTLSGHSLEEMDPELLKAGVMAQCSKPIAPSTLLRKLQQLGVHELRPLEA